MSPPSASSRPCYVLAINGIVKSRIGIFPFLMFGFSCASIIILHIVGNNLNLVFGVYTNVHSCDIAPLCGISCSFSSSFPFRLLHQGFLKHQQFQGSVRVRLMQSLFYFGNPEGLIQLSAMIRKFKHLRMISLLCQTNIIGLAKEIFNGITIAPLSEMMTWAGVISSG